MKETFVQNLKCMFVFRWVYVDNAHLFIGTANSSSIIGRFFADACCKKLIHLFSNKPNDESGQIVLFGL